MALFLSDRKFIWREKVAHKRRRITEGTELEPGGCGYGASVFEPCKWTSALLKLPYTVSNLPCATGEMGSSLIDSAKSGSGIDEEPNEF